MSKKNYFYVKYLMNGHSGDSRKHCFKTLLNII